MKEKNTISPNATTNYLDLQAELKVQVSKNFNALLASKEYTKKRFAEEAQIPESTINDWFNVKSEKKKTQLPPASFFVVLKNMFGINIDDFLTKDIDTGDIKNAEPISEIEREMQAMYSKFVGCYTAYYLDTDSYKGRDYHDDVESLKFGVVSILENKSTVAKSTYECIAILGFPTKKAVEDAKKELSKIKDISKLRSLAKEKYSKRYYSGDFTIEEHFAYLYMKHGTSDRALAIFHCPTTNKESYVGGLGTINSVSKGREKMPTIQFIGISRNSLEQSEEEIHKGLLLSYPTLKADRYAPELVKTFKALYVDKNSEESELSDLQKQITVRSNLELYIKESLEHNMFRYAKVSNRDDDAFYHWITSPASECIAPDLL